MAEPLILRFYLENDLRQSAAAGKHNFINLIVDVVQDSGFRVEFKGASMAERLKAEHRRGYALAHMKPPPGANGLTFRRVYHYPFWQIDASDQRWKWRVAQAKFEPEIVDLKPAERFFSFWQDRLFGSSPGQSVAGDYIYVPLQGRLLDHRSFQLCSPLQMLKRIRAAKPDTPVVTTLHPKETYGPDELHALQQMVDADPMLTLDQGNMVRHLQNCAFVVTQNSSVAFSGYFFRKSAILFAAVDFHHIALSGDDPDAFDRIASHTPDYERYLWWFWQDQSINAGHPSAREKIAARLSGFGWPI